MRASPSPPPRYHTPPPIPPPEVEAEPAETQAPPPPPPSQALQEHPHDDDDKWHDAHQHHHPHHQHHQEEEEGEQHTTTTTGLRQRKPIPESSSSSSSSSSPPPQPQAQPQAAPAKKDYPIESRRTLGGFEALFSHTVSEGLGTIYYIVDFEGPPDTTLLAESMTLQVKRHPNLRSKLSKNGKWLEAVPFEACPPVLVSYVESEDVAGYMEKSVREAKVLRAGEAPYLWDLTLHHTPSSEATHMLFIIHHAISDGDSLLRLFQALVAGMHTLDTTHSLPADRKALLASTTPLPQLPSVDAQLYPQHNGYYIVYHMRSLLREAYKVLIRPRIPAPLTRTPHASHRTTRIASFSLDTPDFKRLLKTCKAQQTSVTGALVAATAQAMEEFIPSEPNKYKMKVEILVNFRSKAKEVKHSTEAHQLYAAPMDVVLEAGSHPETALDFWTAARQTKGEIETFLEDPARWMETLDFFTVLGHHPISKPLFQLFSGSYKQGRLKAISISNLGVTDKLYQQVGPWKLGRMQMGIDETYFGHSIFLAVASHEGRLNFTISYVDPVVNRKMAEEYGQAVIRALVNACPPAELDAPPTPLRTPVSLTAKPQLLGVGGGGGGGGLGGERGADPLTPVSTNVSTNTHTQAQARIVSGAGAAAAVAAFSLASPTLASGQGGGQQHTHTYTHTQPQQQQQQQSQTQAQTQAPKPQRMAPGC